MVDKDELTRRTTDDMRVYTNFTDIYLPSVSTVLDEEPTPKGLKIWKQNNPDWEDILNYKANRGTLIHYELLNQLVDGDMWSPEESRSEEYLKDIGRYEEYEEDLEFAKEAWDEITEKRGISKDTILDIECFVTNTNIGYAGQFDVLYIDKDGNVVLADVKTSKRVYPKHKKQLTAYENALNIDVDILEVLRIHPDSETKEISQSTKWLDDRDKLFEKFVSLREGMDDVDEKMRGVAEDGKKG